MHINSFALRQITTFIARIITATTLPPRETTWPDHFDNQHGIGPVKRRLFYKHRRSGVMLPYKGDPQLVEPETKIGIEAHITAVAFGTTARARKFWSALIQAGDIAPDLAQNFGDTLEAQAQRMALHQRFWTVAYHWIALLNGDVLHNNGIERKTYHGNGGNGPLVGVCLEGDFPGLEKNRKPKHNGYDEHTIETGRAALRLAVKHSRDRGAPIEWLYAHRQYSEGRVGDPGEGWWREIGLVVAAELDLQVDYGFFQGTGKPIPIEWDPRGLVDYHGRRIRRGAPRAAA